jgi:hypothetical protein
VRDNEGSRNGVELEPVFLYPERKTERTVKGAGTV